MVLDLFVKADWGKNSPERQLGREQAFKSMTKSQALGAAVTNSPCWYNSPTQPNFLTLKMVTVMHTVSLWDAVVSVIGTIGGFRLRV